MERLLPHKIAIRISNKVVNYNQELEPQKDEIRYGLEWLIASINQILLVTSFSLPLGIFKEAIIILVVGALLRMFSGGAHFKGYFSCLFFSTFQIIIISYFAKYQFEFLQGNKAVITALLIFSLLITILRAPVLNKKSNQFNYGQRLKLKIVSILLFVTFVLISITVVSNTPIMYCVYLALILQAFSLTSFAKLTFGFYDRTHKLSILRR